MTTRRFARLLSLFASFALVGGMLTFTSASAVTTWKPRGEQYPNTVVEKDVAIPMSDGVILRGDVVRPADADGKAIAKRLPVIVTITAYNKTALGSAGGLGGTPADYLVKRGYVQLTVDARGTGSSEGIWRAFDARENKDGGEVMTWAHSSKRPWSNGITGMSGPSYMGISQLWAAAANPPGLKAIFPQVPGADVYRDVVASGGQLDVGFIPLWLGLVTATGLIPPSVGASDPQSAMTELLNHLTGAGTFTVPLLVQALGGGEPAYDGDFYKERSVKNVIDKVKVPAFFVSGEYDLFQRGTPLLFENLNKRKIPTKLVIGPWDHLQASGGTGFDKAGYGSLAQVQLRWFDHYLKGKDDARLNSDIANLTYYEQGTGKWARDSKWIGSSLEGAKLKVSGSSATGGAPGGITSGARVDGTSDIYPIPVQGLCTRSANQWTAGIPNLLLASLPCFSDNQYNDKLGAVFSSKPLAKAVTLQGPINARLYTSSIGGDGMLSVAIEDEAPDGTVSRLSGGWQVISHRALDKTKSRYLDNVLIQPFHPFTKAAQKKLAAGEVAPIDVEIFPTRAKILPGHKLRISVQAFDVPHLLPSLPDLLGVLTVMTVHSSAKYPSTINFPSVGALPTVK
ncbi:putative CocE/NonD family hydrolase [Aeromicrobium panaciterrae]|uniref:CocE/NonD family hydrolase n=1 Tax=Aeromicrobium panaciterrae TaxID=363861 RepID=A0ABU1UPB8_9ACTN|nr:CocE/NonD family hydrolase [Aeromicrobium panaciterrae]MDR7087027.1 putative CocE/NonD family hydrolase [Aeromicrobium panaciterrae]